MRLAFLLVVPSLVISGLAVVPVSFAPTAAADCTSSGGTTLCSQGDSRGTDSGSGPSGGGSGPFVPYPCGYDWYCNDSYGWDIDLDLSPGWPGIGGPGFGGPGGPGIGGPGGPGGRPGGGGGGRGGRR